MTADLFLGFTGTIANILCAIALWRFGMRAVVGFAFALAAWLLYVGVLGASGVIADQTRRPPGIVFIAVPLILVVLAAAVSAPGGRIARAVPIAALIGLQTYRIGVELFLHALWAMHLAPRMLTFEGANVDIWIGALAPLCAWLATRKGSGCNLALAWNVAGLASLANVVIRSAVTAPGPLNLLHAEILNRVVGTFPYTYIAGFLAPLAIVLHVLAIRSLRARRTPGEMRL